MKKFILIGEVIEIRETAKGIVNIKIEYKDGDKLLEERNYTIADSPTAIASFQDNILPKELAEVKTKEATGDYSEEEVITPNVSASLNSVGNLKVGNKIK